MKRHEDRKRGSLSQYCDGRGDRKTRKVEPEKAMIPPELFTLPKTITRDPREIMKRKPVTKAAQKKAALAKAKEEEVRLGFCRLSKSQVTQFYQGLNVLLGTVSYRILL